MIFDAKEVADLVRKFGVNKGEVYCPHCGFRWELVTISDHAVWAICLVEEVAARK
jgi:uncharacterized Zn finger protein (UPF0148 family)